MVKNLALNQKICVLFVALLVIIIFSPTIFGELILIDDLDVYYWIKNSDISLKDLFLPRSKEGGYYRPLIGTSYLFDKTVLNLDTRLMHIDNIVLHTINVICIYIILSTVITANNTSRNLTPAIGALLFGIHPITTESVAWISGRTDIIACNFILLSTALLLKYRLYKENKYIFYALLALLPGLLAKETTIAFFLGFPLLVMANGDKNFWDLNQYQTRQLKTFILFSILSCFILLLSYKVIYIFIMALFYLTYELFILNKTSSKKINSKLFIVFITSVLFSFLFFYLIRKVVFVSNIGSLSRTLKLILDDLNYALQTFLGASAFYFKKFLIPYPLNLAIREIDPIYNLLGVVLFFFCLYLLLKNNIVSAFFLAGIAMFLPALPLSLGTITWTAYAERYIYISVAFWTIAVTILVHENIYFKFSKQATFALTTILILIFGYATLKRNFIWQTNLALLADTVTKSPNFKPIRSDYMAALIASGNIDEAKRQYMIANSIPSIGYMASLDINMADIYNIEGKYSEANKLYQHILIKTHGTHTKAYEFYIRFLEGRFNTLKKQDPPASLDTGKLLIDSMEKLHKINKKPQLLYRAGQISLDLKDCNSALRLFKAVQNDSRATTELKNAALSFTSNLELQSCR